MYQNSSLAVSQDLKRRKSLQVIRYRRSHQYFFSVNKFMWKLSNVKTAKRSIFFQVPVVTSCSTRMICCYNSSPTACRILFLYPSKNKILTIGFVIRFANELTTAPERQSETDPTSASGGWRHFEWTREIRNLEGTPLLFIESFLKWPYICQISESFWSKIGSLNLGCWLSPGVAGFTVKTFAMMGNELNNTAVLIICFRRTASTSKLSLRALR